MKFHSIVRPFKAFRPDFLLPFPAILITLCMPLPLSPHSFFWIEIREKNEPAILRGLKWFCREPGQQPAWAQLRECVVPKIDSSLPTALQLDATKQTAAKTRAASVEHLEPVQRGQSPEPQRGSLEREVSVCACERPQNLQTIHKESRSGSFCREEHSWTSQVSCVWYRQQSGSLWGWRVRALGPGCLGL